MAILDFPVVPHFMEMLRAMARFMQMENINANKDIGLAGSIWTRNQSKVYSANTDGTQKVVIVLCDSDNDLSIGYGSWINKDGDTYLRGRDLYLGASSTASYTTYRPYYRRGDSIDVNMGTAGFVTTGSKEIYFVVPLGKTCYWKSDCLSCKHQRTHSTTK